MEIVLLDCSTAMPTQRGSDMDPDAFGLQVLQAEIVCVCVLLCKTMENATGLAHSDARNVLKEAFKGPAAKPLGVALVLFARLLNYNMSFAACCHSPHRLLILTHSPHVPCRVYVGVSAFPGA